VKGDRLARGIAAVALAIAGVAIIVAMQALSLVEESTDRVRALTSSLEAALAVQRGHPTDAPLLRPPPQLDHEE
jgi:hypothetical protein